ncbi:MAG: hypothetical protein ACK51F_13000 [Rhodospirillales bacterium]
MTTAREGLALVRAFFEGGWFDARRLPAIQDWWAMVFPLRCGTGPMRFALPRWMTGLRPMPALVGHSGLSGAFLFHAPDSGTYHAGTVNQIEPRDLPFRLLAKVATRDARRR